MNNNHNNNVILARIRSHAIDSRKRSTAVLLVRQLFSSGLLSADGLQSNAPFWSDLLLKALSSLSSTEHEFRVCASLLLSIAESVRNNQSHRSRAQTEVQPNSSVVGCRLVDALLARAEQTSRASSDCSQFLLKCLIRSLRVFSETLTSRHAQRIQTVLQQMLERRVNRLENNDNDNDDRQSSDQHLILLAVCSSHVWPLLEAKKTKKKSEAEDSGEPVVWSQQFGQCLLRIQSLLEQLSAECTAATEKTCVLCARLDFECCLLCCALCVKTGGTVGRHAFNAFSCVKLAQQLTQMATKEQKPAKSARLQRNAFRILETLIVTLHLQSDLLAFEAHINQIIMSCTQQQHLHPLLLHFLLQYWQHSTSTAVLESTQLQTLFSFLQTLCLRDDTTGATNTTDINPTCATHCSASQEEEEGVRDGSDSRRRRRRGSGVQKEAFDCLHILLQSTCGLGLIGEEVISESLLKCIQLLISTQRESKRNGGGGGGLVATQSDSQYQTEFRRHLWRTAFDFCRNSCQTSSSSSVETLLRLSDWSLATEHNNTIRELCAKSQNRLLCDRRRHRETIEKNREEEEEVMTRNGGQSEQRVGQREEPEEKKQSDGAEGMAAEIEPQKKKRRNSAVGVALDEAEEEGEMEVEQILKDFDFE